MNRRSRRREPTDRPSSSERGNLAEGCHVSVDESKRQNQPYTMVAVFAPASNIHSLRRELRAVRHGKSRSIHFVVEHDDVKESTLTTLRDHGVRAVVFRAPHARTRRAPRDMCLERLARFAADNGAARIIVELDQTLLRNDKQTLYATLHKTDVEYTHLQRHEDPLLWCADAVAWAWNRDRHWRAKVLDLVHDVVDIEE